MLLLVSRCGTSRRSPWRTPSRGPRPGGPRGCCRWSGPRTPGGIARTADDAAGRRPVRPGDRPARPAGPLTAVVCGDPDAAGRLAERLGGHAAARTATRPRCCSAACRWTSCRWTRARTAVLVQDKDPVLLSGTLRELLDVPASGCGRPPRTALEAAQCADVLDALVQGVAGRRGPDGRPDHRARPVPVRRPAPAARAGPVAGHRPGGAGAGRADLRRRLAHRGADRARACAACGPAAPPWCSPPRPLLLDRADRVVLRPRGHGRGGRRPPRAGAHRTPLPGRGHPRDRDETAQPPARAATDWARTRTSVPDGLGRNARARRDRGDRHDRRGATGVRPGGPDDGAHPARRRARDRARLRGANCCAGTGGPSCCWSRSTRSR